VRIVADTNTVISGLLWQGPPRRLIELGRQRSITLCTSLTLIAELAEVLARSKFYTRAHDAGLTARQLVQDYARIAEIIEPEPLPAPVSRDSDDDQVLACALAAEAAIIVSGDRDLRDLGIFRDIPILAAHQALEVIARTVD
jgi:uncharacterized protein